jgi:hypothetical protein
MTVTELLSFVNCSIEDVPGLDGASLKYFSHYGTTTSGVVLGTASTYSAKTLLAKHIPFTIHTDLLGDRIITLNFHFVVEVRRQLSGEVISSEFSASEEAFYSMYNTWVDGGLVEDTDTLLAVTALDLWLVEELQLLSPSLLSLCDSTNTVLKIKMENY